MGSLPILTVIEQSQISPPPATIDAEKSLPLTFFDFMWLRQPPVHYLFFYEILSITETQFLDTIVPDLKHSLSTTLQYFYPFVGNLVVYSSPDKKPEIRYVEGDSVAVTFAKSDHLDFNELTSNHPRECDKFYHLIPLLGEGTKTSDYIKIPLFSLQVTLFSNHGISIGMTNHHVLGDASTRFLFMNAWTSIARSGSTDSFLSNGTNLPLYDRSVVENPKLYESYLKFAMLETLKEDYKPQMLSGPTDKQRATFVLTRNVMNELKKTVLNQLPTLAYVSSFTVACAYIWSCLAKAKNVNELQMFVFAIDCRTRMDPPVPTTYFGNCLSGCMVMEKTSLLTGKEGFITAAKLFGENLHKVLTNKDGVVLDISFFADLFANGMPTTSIGVAGTPKLKFYNMDFGWGNPKKVETISIDYNGSISMNACKDSNQDLEIGVCLSINEMEAFVRIFDDGLQTYI